MQNNQSRFCSWCVKSNMGPQLSTHDRLKRKIIKKSMLAKNNPKSAGRNGLSVQIGWTEGGDGAHHSERKKMVGKVVVSCGASPPLILYIVPSL